MRFFSLDEVLSIHAHQIAVYGGSLGIRDVGLLQSALHMPEATAFGQELHPTLHEKAAAYLFHIVRNHPFIDGNKRAGLSVCLAFLDAEGFFVGASEDDLVELVLGVARGERTKAEVSVFLSRHSRPLSDPIPEPEA